MNFSQRLHTQRIYALFIENIGFSRYFFLIQTTPKSPGCFLKVISRNVDEKEQHLNKNSYMTSLTAILDQGKLED